VLSQDFAHRRIHLAAVLYPAISAQVSFNE
jgi:hypothetical protein